jgi:hypothetical protein
LNHYAAVLPGREDVKHAVEDANDGHAATCLAVTWARSFCAISVTRAFSGVYGFVQHVEGALSFGARHRRRGGAVASSRRGIGS